ncbi:hypothetical protein AVEN_42481-1 [Araneus ventricosus]|uniref:HTH psq-type domain-containing protein n=1 Tax=Araneus ventricosus TaxID=182803 RepID=A0A4Y2S5U7_ARAVE|nr:hypothetical protein AVEN_42481-1 [Araneus ventricosus]
MLVFLSFFLVNRQYDFKITFGGSYSYYRQCRHVDILSLSSPLLSEIPFYCPPLPEIPFVSKTICLPSFYWYFLSESEALTLPKCRTVIYAMEPTKRKRILLTVEQKFQIVSRIEAGETLTNRRKNLVLEYQQSGI